MDLFLRQKADHFLLSQELRQRDPFLRFAKSVIDRATGKSPEPVLTGLDPLWDRIDIYAEDANPLLKYVYEATGASTDDLTGSEAEQYLLQACANASVFPENLCHDLDIFLQTAGEVLQEASLSYGGSGELPYPPLNDLSQPRLMRLNDFDPSERAALAASGLPLEPVAFREAMVTAFDEHRTKIMGGELDMIGDYVISNHCNNPDDFLKAVHEDPDTTRRATLEEYIHFALENSRDEVKNSDNLLPYAVAKLLGMCLSLRERYSGSAVKEVKDHFYLFAERGLRTTTRLEHFLAPHDFISSKQGYELIPKNLRRILIIGPGLEFVNEDLGNKVPRQSLEPFALLDELLREGRADLGSLQVDLLDINPEVVRHLGQAVVRADQGESYPLTITLGEDIVDQPEYQDYFKNFATALPGTLQGNTEHVEKFLVRQIRISPEVVRHLHPLLTDMTVQNLDAPGTYDLVICFNTMIYWNESERTLVGLQISKILKTGGIFWTDNLLVSDPGERVGQPATTKTRELFWGDFPLHLKAGGMITDSAGKGNLMVLYQKGLEKE